MGSTPQSVPMYLPSGFNLTAAQTCAAMVSAAYDQFNQFTAQSTPKPDSFNWTWSGPSNISSPLAIWWIQKFIASEPIGFLASDGAGNAYLVFRGTMSTADKLADADFGQTSYGLVQNFGSVSKGYYGIYTNLSLPTAPSGQTTLLDAINALSGITTFFFTGHSLGAGLSSLAVPDVSTNSSLTPSSVTMVHYNFGSPRVGDTNFAQTMNFSTSIPTYRVVNTEDLVPMAPPAVSLSGPMVYEHIGTPVDFTANYGSIVTNHSMANTYCYAMKDTSNPYNPLNTGTTNPTDGTGALSRLVTVTPAPAPTPRG
jgi:triacylglycerol lipase